MKTKIEQVLQDNLIFNDVINGKLHDLEGCTLSEVASTKEGGLIIYNVYCDKAFMGSLEDDGPGFEYYHGCQGEDSELIVRIRENEE